MAGVALAPAPSQARSMIATASIPSEKSMSTTTPNRALLLRRKSDPVFFA